MKEVFIGHNFNKKSKIAKATFHIALFALFFNFWPRIIQAVDKKVQFTHEVWKHTEEKGEMTII